MALAGLWHALLLLVVGGNVLKLGDLFAAFSGVDQLADATIIVGQATVIDLDGFLLVFDWEAVAWATWDSLDGEAGLAGLLDNLSAKDWLELLAAAVLLAVAAFVFDGFGFGGGFGLGGG